MRGLDRPEAAPTPCSLGQATLRQDLLDLGKLPLLQQSSHEIARTYSYLDETCKCTVSTGRHHAELKPALPVISRTLLHSGQADRVLSHRWMQSKWNTWPQLPHAMLNPGWSLSPASAGGLHVKKVFIITWQVGGWGHAAGCPAV